MIATHLPRATEKKRLHWTSTTTEVEIRLASK
jgi:hypothetical protein